MIIWVVLAALVGVYVGLRLHAKLPWFLKELVSGKKSSTEALEVLTRHFDPVALDTLSVNERCFPFRMRADLQRALEALVPATGKVVRFAGLQLEHMYQDLTFGTLVGSRYTQVTAVAPQYEDVDVGDDEPVRCLKNGLWLLEGRALKLAVLLSPAQRHGETTGWRIQLVVPPGDEGAALVQPFLDELERAVSCAASYRGKVLSLENVGESYSGQAVAIKVHKLRAVERDEVILPRSTLELLERNIIHFVGQREALARLGQTTKKGVLFYGPPGTGKTHTIHYLARALAGHTTLLITAEQVGKLGDYMVLARLLAPSIVVMEDVDLIARDRSRMGSACEEVLLNKLLNEMDGLREQAEILFVLTTNRPQELEAALASRPGRIDQAIEFPLPDEAGRRKLVTLYAAGIALEPATLEDVVRRTDRVSAAFIKELMRRAVQYHIARQGQGPLSPKDIEQALDELLFSGGSLNLKLLGAEGAAR